MVTIYSLTTNMCERLFEYKTGENEPKIVWYLQYLSTLDNFWKYLLLLVSKKCKAAHH